MTSQAASVLTVSLEELMVSTLAMTDALTKLLMMLFSITDAEFKQKAAGGACGLPAYPEPNDTGLPFSSSAITAPI
jgi:hypothetical protein